MEREKSPTPPNHKAKTSKPSVKVIRLYEEWVKPLRKGKSIAFALMGRGAEQSCLISRAATWQKLSISAALKGS